MYYMTVRSLRSVSSAWSELSPNVRGPLWMIATGVCLSSMGAMVRHVSKELEAPEIVFFRCLFGLLIMLPMVARSGLARLRTRAFGGHVLRAAFAVSAWVCWFYGLAYIPLADAFALGFTSPLFTAILAAVFLRETMRLRRWAATAVGFMGALIVIRPGFAAVEPEQLIVLLSALMFALLFITTKSLTRTESPFAIVFYMALLTTPASLIPALLVWQTPSPEAWPWLIAIAALAVMAHACLSRAFAAADATLVTSFNFFQLIVATLLGLVFFGEIPTLYTLLGAAVIFASSLYLLHREAQRRRGHGPGERPSA